LDTLRWKARGDLLTFAAKHPGALSGYFLAMVHAKMGLGTIRKTSQLQSAQVATWCGKHGGVTEIRDTREMATLAMVMDLVNQKDLRTAMDTLAQRILAIQQAKKKGGTWEKAESIELTPSAANELASGSMLRLTA